MEKQAWLKELSEFLVENSHHGWASDENKAEPLFPGWKRHVYLSQKESGLWVADDNYTGYFRAPGFTLVTYNGKNAWMMQYGGKGMVEGLEDKAKPTFDFLKRALLYSTPARPFRGPEYFAVSETSGEEWKYQFHINHGDIISLSANEKIYNKGILMFTQDISVSLILDKDKERKVVEPWNF